MKVIVGASLGVVGAVATLLGVSLTAGFSTEALVAAVVAAAGFVPILVKALRGERK